MRLSIIVILLAAASLPNFAMAEDAARPPRPARYVQTWKHADITWKPADHDYAKPPRDVVEAIIKKHELAAGDVIGFHDDRGSMHYLLDREEESGAWTWQNFIDPAGYLKLPLKFTNRTRDALAAYDAVLRGRHAVAVELSPSDRFVVKLLGMVGPKWQIHITTIDGQPEFIAIKRGADDWREFELSSSTPEQIRQAMGQ